MRDFKLKLRGFIGVKKGLGLDEIELDLTGLTGLVALAGPNGRGKTTILDNLHPFPCLGSRSGALSHHVFLRDSYRDISFNHAGHEYRCLIKIDAQSESSEGYLWIDGDPQIKGKISEYKKKVQEIFGSQTLFFESTFCAQNAKPLSEKRTGELRDLFAEFLRLDELQAKHETAKQIKNVITGKIESHADVIKTYQTQLAALETVESEINQKKSDITNLDMTIRHDLCNHEMKEDYLKSLKLKLQEQQIKAAQVAELSKALVNSETQHNAGKMRQWQQLEALRNKASSLQSEIQQASTVLADKQAIADAVKIVEFNSNLKEDLTGKIDALSNKLAKIKDDITAKEKIISQLNVNKTEAQNKIGIAGVESEIRSLKQAMLDLEKKEDSCQSKTCPFIVTAVKASEKLPDAEVRLKTLRETAARNVAAIEVEIADHQTIKNALQEEYNQKHPGLENLRQTQKDVVAKIESCKALAAKAGQIAVAEAGISEKQKALDANIIEGKAFKENYDKFVTDFNDEKATKQTEIDAIKAGMDASITPEKIAQVEAECKSSKASIDEMTIRKAQLESEIKLLQDRIKSAQSIKDTLAQEQAKADAMAADLSDWAYIQSGLSKDRLQALEIAGAAPTITSYANRLLSSAFGPQVQVLLKTQDDNGKEILEIIVVDEDGDEVSLSDRSGGQKVWALKALRLAMAMLSKEKSGRDFKTIMTDEEDGALDIEKAVAFIHLYRAFMTEGCFDTCFYISHKEQCVNLADHRLEFGDGGIEIV